MLMKAKRKKIFLIIYFALWLGDQYTSVQADCSNVLTVPTTAPDAVTLSYSYNSCPGYGCETIHPDSSYSSTQWDNYFSNTDSTNCAISSCTLYDTGCVTERSTNVWMESSSPWDVIADRNDLTGYDLTLCVSCTNGVQTV